MKARFIGDPAERESGQRLSREAGDWFDVPEGMETKYANNSHFETDDAPKAEAPKRGRPRKIVTEEANGELPSTE